MVVAIALAAIIGTGSLRPHFCQNLPKMGFAGNPLGGTGSNICLCYCGRDRLPLVPRSLVLRLTYRYCNTFQYHKEPTVCWSSPCLGHNTSGIFTNEGTASQVRPETANPRQWLR